jgi:hypothetical protein
MLNPAAAIELATEMFRKWEIERKALDRIDLWYRWDQQPYKLPASATREMKALEELSRTPWLGLVVTSTAQLLYVDGWRSLAHEKAFPDRATRPVPAPWETWQANDLDAKQIPVHRAALAYGYSFATVLPGQDEDGGKDVAIRGVSPRRMFAAYRDPANDLWPEVAVHVERSGADFIVKLMDEEHAYYLSRPKASDRMTFIEPRVHGVGVVPVARFANQLDLEGRAPGEVEPYIPLARRINKTDYDRLVAQHFNSTVIRTVSGLTKPETDELKNQRAIELGLGRLLVAEDPDTKFGSLPATPLGDLIAAKAEDVKALSAASQTPTHELTGVMINLSAEALAAAKAAQRAKVAERKRAFGSTWGQVLRLAEHIKGDTEGARDFGAHVSWQDDETASFSQAVDALGKAAQMLGIPLEALWAKFPGATQSDVEEWKVLADNQAANDPNTLLAQGLLRQSEPQPPSGD